MKKTRNTDRIGGPDESIPELVQRYLKDLKRHRYSPKTVISYGGMLDHFLSFSAERAVSEIRNVTPEVLEAFRNDLTASDLAANTVAVHIRVVRCFFKYLDSEGVIFDNPTFGLKTPKTERRLCYVPTPEEMTKLLAEPDTSIPPGIRDRAILEVAYSTGIRRGELTGLDMSSVNLRNGLLRVFGKGSKERMLPLGKEACRWLETYVADGARKELLRYNLNEQALWIGTHHRRMSHNALGVRIWHYCREAGLRSISPHAIRRACATHMLANGAHPVQIRMLLGHADLRTLSHYLRVSVQDMKKTHAKSRPGR